jgi:hypothetical protein
MTREDLKALMQRAANCIARDHPNHELLPLLDAAASEAGEPSGGAVAWRCDDCGEFMERKERHKYVGLSGRVYQCGTKKGWTRYEAQPASPAPTQGEHPVIRRLRYALAEWEALDLEPTAEMREAASRLLARSGRSGGGGECCSGISPIGLTCTRG